MAARRSPAALARALECAGGGSASRALVRAAAQDVARVLDVLERSFHRRVHVDAAAAARLARIAQRVARAARAPVAEGRALRLAAVSHHLAGRTAAALDAIARAAALFRAGRSVRDEGDAHRLALEIGVPRADLAAARRAHARARACYRRAGADPRREAALAQSLGNALHQAGRYDDALGAYMHARGLFRRAQEPVRGAQAEYNIANILASRDRLDAARARYEEARGAFAGAHLTARVAQVDYALAGVDVLEARLDEALERLDAARAVHGATGDRAGAAHADLDAAEALLRANRAAEAAERAEAAARWFARAGHAGDEAAARAVIAAAELQLGRPRRARRLFERAGRLAQRTGNRVLDATIDLGLAQACRAAGDPRAAVPLARRAAATLARAGARSRHARGLAVAAAASLDAGRVALARRFATGAEAKARACGDARTAAAALLTLARTARGDEEYRVLVRAEKLVERLRLGVTSEESRLAFALDKSEVYEALVKNRLEQGGARATREALLFAEKGKARALAERLAAGRLGNVLGRGPAARAALRRLTALECRLAAAEARLESGTPVPGVRGASPARTDAAPMDGARAVETLARRRAAATRGLARVDESAALLFGTALRDPLRLVQQLPAGTVVLEYALTGDDLHLFALTRESLRAVPALARMSEVQPHLERLRFQLGKGVLGDAHQAAFAPFIERSLATSLGALYRLLLEPVARELDGRNIVVVPHGALHGLPFHALLCDEVPLLERAVVSYAPSLAVLGLMLRDGATRTALGPPVVLGVADEAAPAIGAEIAAICARLPQARVYRGAEATRHVLAEAGAAAALLHVASHGFYRADVPLAGGLKLGDAWLTLQEVYSLGPMADFVVLSGCETGRGTVHSGDEWVGLVRGFIQAGARAVVASLWEVHDRSATDTMADFYEHLSHGTPAALALTLAQRAARRRDPSTLRWAPFAFVGDPAWSLASRLRAPQRAGAAHPEDSCA